MCREDGDEDGDCNGNDPRSIKPPSNIHFHLCCSDRFRTDHSRSPFSVHRHHHRLRKGAKKKTPTTAPAEESVVENVTEPSHNNPPAAVVEENGAYVVEDNDAAIVEENGTEEQSQNHSSAVVVNNKEPSQNDSTALGEIDKVDSSENQEKMDTDKAEPVKKAANKKRKGKQVVEEKVETKKKAVKRRRVERPVEEPEYFEEERNLEDLWKQTFPVGTEWELLDNIYQYNWSFRNLEEAIENEGGLLADKKVYLFD